MKQLFLSVNDGSMSVVDTPAPTVKDNTVIVETLYSVVSAGTELRILCLWVILRLEKLQK